MIVIHQTNVAAFAGGHTVIQFFNPLQQNRTSKTSITVVVAGAKKHRGFLRNVGRLMK